VPKKWLYISLAVLGLWAIASVFIIFGGSRDATDIQALGDTYLSDITAFADDSRRAGIRADELASSNQRLAERSRDLERRAISAEKSVVDIESRFRKYRNRFEQSVEGNKEVGSLGRELESLIRDVPGISGKENSAP